MAGIEERYTKAVTSSHLRLTENEAGDVDVLIAAGKFADPLGGLFSRLRAEFDVVHAEVKHEAKGQHIGSVNTRMLTMMRLKSLKTSKAKLIEMAQAKRTKYSQPFAWSDVERIAWQALSAWLDPTCTHCDGRGKSGGYSGGPEVLCTHCDGGKRPMTGIGKSERERSFALELVTAIEEAVARFSTTTNAAANNRIAMAPDGEIVRA